MEIRDQLRAPFHPSKLHWRVGATNKDKTSAIALAYLNARDVMNRLDDVMGYDWQNKYSLSDSGLLICDIGLKINSEWIWRANGAGASDIEAEKGQASDAFKRAAVLFGVGQYLYSLETMWTPIKAQGRSYVIAQNPTLPAWATPEGYKEAIEKRNAA
jgi:hypothetical protein